VSVEVAPQVFWDHEKGHHYSVMVEHALDLVVTQCLDCEDVLCFTFTEWLGCLDYLKEHGNCQIIAWVER
jgi:hypothetical protein